MYSRSAGRTIIKGAESMSTNRSTEASGQVQEPIAVGELLGEQIREVMGHVASICQRLSAIPVEYRQEWEEFNRQQAAHGEPAYVLLYSMET
jgi:hypothetical protein